MAFYPISEAALRAKIKPEWLIRATALTATNVAASRLVEAGSIWSEIKSVYMDWQADKCVYCEFPLGGSSTQDVEHFRPKSKISVWPKASAPPYNFGTGMGQDTGYYWLAFDPCNYAASCKDCNSALKRDYFPVAGTRGTATAHVTQLNASERPLLLFPFGDWGDDPNEFLVFKGIFVEPKSGLTPANAQRAKVMIDFFRLNERRNLLRNRFTVLDTIWTAVELRQTSHNAATVKRAETTILRNIVPEAPHSLCARAFLELMQSSDSADQQRATDLWVLAEQHLVRLGLLKDRT